MTPKRKFNLELSVGGDSWDDMIGLLDHYRDLMAQGQVKCVSGSPSCGGFYEWTCDLDMTHDKYMEAIKGKADTQ
jgi:hypothetical protein